MGITGLAGIRICTINLFWFNNRTLTNPGFIAFEAFVYPLSLKFTLVFGGLLKNTGTGFLSLNKPVPVYFFRIISRNSCLNGQEQGNYGNILTPAI